MFRKIERAAGAGSVQEGIFIWRKRRTSAMLVHFALDASALMAM